ncbi:MAG: M28 family peptidase [Phycisphaerales bacterium]
MIQLLRPSSAARLLALGLHAVAPALAQTAPEPTDYSQSVKNQIPLNEELLKLSDEDRMYLQHVTTLSNPFFEGRAPGLRGNALAAEYIEFCFNKLNLVPAFEAEGKPSMRQPFPAGTETRVLKQEVALGPTGAPAIYLNPGIDFSLLGIGNASGTANVAGPLVFVGYGIQDGIDGYNTFPAPAEAPAAKPDDKPAEGEAAAPKGLLEGKVAMVFRFEPMDDKGRSRWVDDAAAGEWSNKASYTAKIAAISKHKPAAILIVNPPNCDDVRANKLDEMRSVRLGRTTTPVLMLSTVQGEAIAKANGTTLLELRKLADKQGTVMDLPKSAIAIDAQTKREPVQTQNVAAVLKGKGALADEYIVVGAHFDHVGYGYQGSRAGPRGAGKLHPGADDNASGTSGMLMAASKLSDLYAALPPGSQARSILFIGFSGEELGLIGSRYFVGHSPIPESKTYAMLNMDMIGRVRKNGVEVDGVGSADKFMDLLKPIFDRSGMKVTTLPGGQGPSDHASFYAASIPCLHFFTGLHSQYHLPEDFYFTINPQGAMKVVSIVCDTAMTLGTRSEPLTFTKAKGPSVNLNDPALFGGEKESDAKPLGHDQAVQQAKSNLTGEPAATTDTGRPKVKVRFGIGPGSYGDETAGVLVGDVYPGTSAADAGIKPGDRMLKWNGETIANVEGWMPMLYKANPGDTVAIVLLRDGKEQTVQCKLKARDDEPK